MDIENGSNKAGDLRRQAEHRAADNAAHTADSLQAMTPGEIQNLVHELRVYQIELEMQNVELQRAQEEIEASRERYFDLYDLAPVGYVTVSDKGIILEANLTATTLLGVTRGNLINQTFSQFILKQDQDDFYRHYRKSFKTGEKQSWALRMNKPDGGFFWARLEAIIAHTQGQGQVCRIVLNDITRNKLLEEIQASRLALAECDASYDIVTLLQVLIDEAEKLTGSNMGFCHFLEEDQNTIDLMAWSTNTLNNMCNAKSTGVHYPVSEAGVWADCIRERRPVIHNDYASLPHKKRLPEGHVPIVRELVVPVFRGDRIEAILGVGNKASDYNSDDVYAVQQLAELARDIIIRKRSEQKSEKLQSQLIQSQKMEAIGLLAGGMAHDFNNMLAIIMGNTGIALMDMPMDAPNRVLLTEIMSASERARELTMKLLTFARRDKLEVQGIKILQIIEDLQGMLTRTAPKSIDIEAIVKDNCSISCDQNQIQQAFINICNNAMDAMPLAGKLTIQANEIEFHERPCESCGLQLNGRYCLIQVSDTGIGMTEAVRSRITEPFFTTKGIGKGTGLGLSVTLGILKSHNGHLHIHSEPGAGTRVEILLPITEGSKVHCTPAEERMELKGSETILVVDDERGVLNMAGRLLSAYGYKPLLAENGETAVALYKEHRDEIAVVVLDLMMPGMDGAEVNRRMKEMNPDVKIVFVSGFSESGIAESLLKDTGRTFVQKPFQVNELHRAIRELIDDSL